MKWNRKELLKAAKELGDSAGLEPYQGKNVDDLIAYFESAREKGVSVKGLSTTDAVLASEIREAYTKTVEISYDSSSDDVKVTDMATASMDEEEETKEAENEDEEYTKAYARFRELDQKRKNGMPFAKSIHEASFGPGTASLGRIGDKRSAQLKAYERSAKGGIPLRSTRQKTVFDNAEKAEAIGAAMRLTVMGGHPYAQKSMDEQIVTKAGSTFNPGTGGALVFGDYSTEMIELFDQYGVARGAVGVTSMSEGSLVVPRLTSDVTVYDVGENHAITASDEGYDNIELNATKTAALKRLPMELLNDSAINVVDIVARSIARAVGKWEDEAYINGSHGRTGLDTLVATTGTDRFDSNSGGWSSITISHVQSAIGLLPGWAHAEGIGIMCSSAFYSTVLDTFAFNAGGNSGNDLKTGFGGMTRWGQYPVFISEAMPSSYSDGQNVMYIGAFSASSKFGLVSGSESLQTSDQRYFDQDQFAVRYTQRWDINLHDIGGSDSGVVALQA